MTIELSLHYGVRAEIDSGLRRRVVQQLRKGPRFPLDWRGALGLISSFEDEDEVKGLLGAVVPAIRGPFGVEEMADQNRAWLERIIVNLGDEAVREEFVPWVEILVRTDAGYDPSALPEIRAEDYGEPSVKGSAILVELAREDCDGTRIEALADLAARDLSGEFATLQKVVDAVVRRSRTSARAHRFLVELARRIPGGGWRARGVVVDALGDLLELESSGLGRRQVWDELKLPGRLLDFV